MKELSRKIRRGFGFLFDLLGLFQAGIRISDNSIQYFEAWRGLSGFKIKKFKEKNNLDKKKVESALVSLFKKKKGIMPYAINIAFESKGVIAKIMTIPNVPKKRIAASVLWEVKKVMPINLKTVVTDYHILGNINEDGQSKLKVLFVAAKKHEVQKMAELLTNVHIYVKAVRYIPLSYVNEYKKESLDLITAYVLIYGNCVSISIIKKNSLLYINTKYPGSKSALNRHVVDVLKKYQEHNEFDFNQIIISYGNSDLASLLMNKFDVKVVVVDRKSLAFDLEEKHLTSGHVPLFFSLLRHNQLDINLLDTQTKKRNLQKRLLASGALGVSCVFIVLFGFFIYMKANMLSLSKDMIVNLKHVKNIRSKTEQIKKEIKAVSILRNKTSRWSLILAGISKIIKDKNLYGKLWLLKISNTKRRIGYIKGISFSNSYVTIFLNELEKFKLLDRIEIDYTKPITIRKVGCIEFRIRFKI